MTKPGVICEDGVLPGGTPVIVRTAPMRSADTMGASALFHFGGSDVQLDIGPDDAHETSAPVKYADTDPVQKEQETVAGAREPVKVDKPANP